jgi:hypothetical protein
VKGGTENRRDGKDGKNRMTGKIVILKVRRTTGIGVQEGQEGRRNKRDRTGMKVKKTARKGGARRQKGRESRMTG